jgi:hypothetical protein
MWPTWNIDFYIGAVWTLAVLFAGVVLALIVVAILDRRSDEGETTTAGVNLVDPHIPPADSGPDLDEWELELAEAGVSTEPWGRYERWRHRGR